MAETNLRKKKIDTLMLCKCAMFTALISVGAFIKIPIPAVPFTLQYLFTMLAGLLLGAEYGALSVIVYVVLGLIGLPIFAEGGGIGYVAVPSFGYLIGFIAGTFVTGKIANKVSQPSALRLAAANFIGLLIVYTFGILYYYIAKNCWGEGVAFRIVFKYCFLLAVPGDIVLCLIGILLGKRLIPLIKKG